jgi:hypothetical protein
MNYYCRQHIVPFLLLSIINASSSFQTTTLLRRRQPTQTQLLLAAKAKPDISRFLTDFKTAQGTLVDPYKILKLPRDASSGDIKRSYRNLSRKWHPDAVARKEILPGKW